MRPAEDIEKLLKDINIDTNVKTDDAVLGDVIEAFEKSRIKKTSAIEQNIWRIIMKSRITKFAASAAVIIAFILSMTLSDKTVAPAFGMNDVLAAMAKAEWLHMTWEFTEVNTGSDTAGRELEESWISVTPRRNISINKNGSVSLAEYSIGELKVQKYEPETNVLTTTYRVTNKNYSHTSIVDMYLEQISGLEERGARIKYINTVYDGNPAKIINIDNLNKNGVHQKFSIVADVETYLPKRMTYHYESADQSATANVTFDYPKTGPTNIYQTGVPHDAEVKIIDHRPSPEFIEVVKPYRAARENLPQQRIVVDVENENNNRYRVCVIYTDGKKERFEELLWVRDDAPPTTDDFSTILDWVNSTKSDELNIQLYDGAVKYRVNRDYRNRWTNSKEYSPSYKPSFVVGGFLHRGWPRLHKGQLVENEYSINNHLLCIETWRNPNIKDNRLLEAAEKTLYYIDTEHDYICVRIEKFKHLVAPQSNPEISELDFDSSNNTPSQPYSITEVMEFGRTDTGHWYPSLIITKKQSWRDYGGGWETRENTFETRLYVDAKPEFPDGIFDPENLPHIGE